MPTYQYECGACQHSFDVYQSMLDAKLKKCPKCKKLKLVRLIGTGTGVIFKGTGFYETDYKRPAKKEASETCCPCKDSGSESTTSCGSKEPPASQTTAAAS